MQLTSQAVLGGYLLATITGPRSTDKLIRAVPAVHRSPYLGQVEGVRERVRGGCVRVPTTLYGLAPFLSSAILDRKSIYYCSIKWLNDRLELLPELPFVEIHYFYFQDSNSRPLAPEAVGTAQLKNDMYLVDTYQFPISDLTLQEIII